MSEESFWKPTRPGKEYFSDSHEKPFCYQVAAFSCGLAWVITGIWYFKADRISDLFHMKWHWAITAAAYLAALPAAILVGVGFFIWISVMDAFLGYLSDDTWRWAEKLSPKNPGICLRALQFIQLLVFAPVVCAVFGGLSTND